MAKVKYAYAELQHKQPVLAFSCIFAGSIVQGRSVAREPLLDVGFYHLLRTSVVGNLP